MLVYGSVTVQQSGITGAVYNEINDYIDLDDSPFSGETGAFGGTNARKFLSTVDIPDKEILLVLTTQSTNEAQSLCLTDCL